MRNRYVKRQNRFSHRRDYIVKLCNCSCTGLFTSLAFTSRYSMEDHHCATTQAKHYPKLPMVKSEFKQLYGLLESCRLSRGIRRGSAVHTRIVVKGLVSNLALATKLMEAYDACGRTQDALQVFDDMPTPNTSMWNAIIKLHVRRACHDDALAAYSSMLRSGVSPDKFTFCSLLKACAALSDINKGMAILTDVVAHGFRNEINVCNAFMSMYAKCGLITQAAELFESMAEKDEVSWNTLISGFVQSGQSHEALRLFRRMIEANGQRPNSLIVASLLSACASAGDSGLGKVLQGYALKTGTSADLTVQNALIDMYGKCRCVRESLTVFNSIKEKDTVSWNTVIYACVQAGMLREGSEHFYRMVMSSGLKPNTVTLAIVVSLGLNPCKLVHEYMLRSGMIKDDTTVYNALIDMYAKCGSMDMARRLFINMVSKDLVSWSTLVSGYVRNGYPEEALRALIDMQIAGWRPNSVTILSVLPACGNLEDLRHSRELHGQVVRLGLDYRLSVSNALISTYMKCNNIDVACRVFCRMPEKDAISWNAVVAGCASNGFQSRAMVFFQQMVDSSGLWPDSVTIIGILPACASLGALEKGKEIHGFSIRRELAWELSVENTLVDMYSKCGKVCTAHSVFDRMSERNVVSWNVMIAGYGMHGLGKDAIDAFQEMQMTGTKPDSVTLLAVLFACRHGGLAEEALKYFDVMSNQCKIVPRMEHYTCLVDCLGYSGRLEDAWNVINKMPFHPDAAVWGALLTASKEHSHEQFEELSANHLMNFESGTRNSYSLVKDGERKTALRSPRLP